MSKRIVEQWVERATYDLRTAEAMYEARRYLYVAFMCQQAFEKILKAVIISRGGDIARTHNLVRLAELAGIADSISEIDLEFLATITPFAIEARYGDYKDSLSEIVNRTSAASYAASAKKVFAWVKKQIKK
jgi:HEPN domain-containing protein